MSKETIALEQLWSLFKEYPQLLILFAENGMHIDLVKLNDLRKHWDKSL